MNMAQASFTHFWSRH